MGHLELGRTVTIHRTARIDVEHLEIGANSTIGPNCVIEGRDVRIGQEFWMDEGAVIGGGSCFEPLSMLRAGHFLHMGRDSIINTARPVVIGNEVGLGTRTSLYTHGSYLSALNGFPVAFAPITIGNNVWLPGAIVNAGVTIGNNVVVGVNSLVTHDLPDGCLAAGSPVQILQADAYPRPLMGTRFDRFWHDFIRDYPDQDAEIWAGTQSLRCGDTRFYFIDKHISGPVTEQTEKLRNQLRRYGIRFYSRPAGDEYQDWA